MGISEYAGDRGPCPACGNTKLQFYHMALPTWMGGNGLAEWVTIDVTTKKQTDDPVIHVETIITSITREFI